MIYFKALGFPHNLASYSLIFTERSAPSNFTCIATQPSILEASYPLTYSLRII